MSEIRDRIRTMRKKNNITLLEMAECLGVSEATAQRYESGNIKHIKHESICKLAKLFNCDPTYLMGWGPDSPGTYNSTITNSSVVNGNNSTMVILRGGKDAPIELSDQAVELLRVFNDLDLKGQTLLLSRAFELEEKHSKV